MPGPPAGKRTSGTPSNLAKAAPINAVPTFAGRRDSGPVPPPPPPPPAVSAPVQAALGTGLEPTPMSQWAAFSGQIYQEFSATSQATAPPLSAFDQKLQEDPPCSIESLLDEEEILQEFRRGNERLVQRLSAYEGMRVLIEQVTRAPTQLHEEAGDSSFLELNVGARRRPWIVSELLSSGCNDSIFEAFRQPGGSDLLDLLWSFLDGSPESPTVAVLAGYFCSIVTTLVTQCAVEVAAHLTRRRDPSKLFDLFLQRIESRSFVDLLIALLCAEVPDSAPDQVVFPRDRLAWRLVAHLSRQGNDPSVLEHIVLIIDAIVARACANTLHESDELLQQFSDSDLVTALIDQVVNGVSAHGCSAGSVAAAAVLSIVVSHTHHLPLNQFLPVRSPDFRPTPPSRPISPPPPPTEEEPTETTCSTMGATDPELEKMVPDCWSTKGKCDSDKGFVVESNGVVISQTICSSLPRICSVFVSDPATSGIQIVEQELSSARHRFETGDVREAVAELRAHAPRVLHSQSTTSLDFISEDVSVSAARRPISAIILEVLGLIAHLAMTGRPEVIEAAFHAAVLPRCLQAMFRFPWNTLLHNAATSVLREFIGRESAAMQIATDLLGRVDLMEQLVEEVQYDARVRSQWQLAETAGQRRALRQRVGYAGHLRIICQDLLALSTKSAEVAAALEVIPGWSTIVVPEVEATTALTSEPLGGVGPDESTRSPEGSQNRSELDCISAVQTFMASLTDEVDLNLEDLRDLNEELDADEEMDMALVMAAAHAKHRSRGGAVCPDTQLDDENNADDYSLSQENAQHLGTSSTHLTANDVRIPDSLLPLES